MGSGFVTNVLQEYSFYMPVHCGVESESKKDTFDFVFIFFNDWPSLETLHLLVVGFYHVTII